MSSSTNPQEQGSQIEGSDDPHLTIGVEIEGLIPFPNETLHKDTFVINENDLTETTKRALVIIAEDIQPDTSSDTSSDTSIKIKKVDCEHAVGENHVKEDKAEGELLGERGKDNIYQFYKDAWTMCVDESVMNLGHPGVGAVEIRSKVYRDRDKLREHIKRILFILTDKYGFMVKGGKDDRRPGVHVHIGNTNSGGNTLNGGFEILHVRRLLTLVWIYEPAIMALHATWKGNYIRYGSLLRLHTHFARLLGIELPPSYELSTRWRCSESDFEFDAESEEGKLFLKDYEDNIPKRCQPGDEKGRETQDEYNSKLVVKWIWAAKSIDLLALGSASQFGERRSALNICKLCLVGNSSHLYHKIHLINTNTNYKL